MKKIFFLLALALFLSSCGSFTSTSNSKDVNFFAGKEGLSVEFSKVAPPENVFENSDFPIFLRVRNLGAYDIQQKSGTIAIGLEKDYVPKIKSIDQSGNVGISGNDQILFDVKGKSQINPKGEEILVSMTAATGKLDPQSETKQSTMTATFCYPYKTTLSTPICIDPDIADASASKKICKAQEMNFNSGQGAPIAVTKIIQQMVPDNDKVKPQFLIFIENIGSGSPININNYNKACTQSDDSLKNFWNVASVKVSASNNEQLVCCPNKDGKCAESESGVNDYEGFLKFRDKKDFVRCTFKNGIPKNADAYTSPLKVEIDYGYVQTYAASFTIQKPAKF